MQLIDKQAAIITIAGQPPEPRYPAFYADQIAELPEVDAIPLTHELADVFKDIETMYECAKGQMWISDPIAWTLYKVWRAYEEKQMPGSYMPED